MRHYVGYFIFLRHTNFSFETCKFSIPFSPKINKKKDNQKKWWRNSISTLQYADCEIKTNKKFNILRVRQHFVSTAIVRAHLITARLRDIATHATLNDISANIYIDIFKCEIEMRINIGIFWISAATTCCTFIYGMVYISMSGQVFKSATRALRLAHWRLTWMVGCSAGGWDVG